MVSIKTELYLCTFVVLIVEKNAPQPSGLAPVLDQEVLVRPLPSISIRTCVHEMTWEKLRVVLCRNSAVNHVTPYGANKTDHHKLI